MSNDKLKFANLKVGLTVFIGIAIFLFFIVLVGSEINYFSETLKMRIFVQNVEGFSTGSMVTLGGLKIGSVDEIEFAKRDGQNGINVGFTINSKYSPKITKTSIASVKNKGLLGDKYIDISIGQPGEDLVKDGEYLPLASTITLETFTNKLEPMMDNFAVVLENLNTITTSLSDNKSAFGILLNDEHVGTELKSVINKLNLFATNVSRKNGTLGKLATDSQLYDNLNAVTSNFNDISTSIKNGEGTLGKLINEDTLYNEISSISKRLDTMISKTESDSTFVGGLFNDEKFYKDFNSLIKDLDKLIIDLKENPDRYVQFSVF